MDKVNIREKLALFHDHWGPRIVGELNGQHVKVVMLSAKGREVEVNKGLGMGADLYVTKPFSTRDLLEKIKALLA